MSLTVRIDWKYILSRVRVSVRPRIFLYVKNRQNLWETRPPARVFISMASDRHCRPRSGPSRLGATDLSNSDNRYGGDGGVCVCVCAHAWPRLIMIIIKIIILYFIQIRHTDDLPSTGNRLVGIIDTIVSSVIMSNKRMGDLRRKVAVPHRD